MIEDGKTGELFESGNAEQLTEIISKPWMQKKFCRHIVNLAEKRHIFRWSNTEKNCLKYANEGY